MLTKTDKSGSKTVKAAETIGDKSATRTVRSSIVSAFNARPSDPTDKQILVLIEQSGTLDFWARDEEDVYTRDDGEPI